MSDIDTAVADSLKVLDLKWPIREADILQPQLRALGRHFALPRTVFQFEGNKSREQRRRIELSDSGLHVGKAARIRVQRNDIAIADRSQRYKAEVDQVAGDREIVMQRADPRGPTR